MAEHAKSEFAAKVLAAAEACEVEIRAVPTPELQPNIDKIWVRGMDGEERSKLSGVVSDRATGKMRPDGNERFVVRVACNETGELLFTDGDVPAIRKWPAPLIQRIWEAAAPICGLASRQLEDDVKN